MTVARKNVETILGKRLKMEAGYIYIVYYIRKQVKNGTQSHLGDTG